MFTKGTDVEDFHTPAGCSTDLRSKKLGVAAIFEIQLEVLGIQPKLSKSPTNLSGRGVVRGWPSPTLISSFVLKLKETAVRKEHSRFVELCVSAVAGECLAREICHGRHGDTVAVQA